MCLLWTDQHAEFYRTKSVQDQGDPNLYHHNEYYDEKTGAYPGEGALEVVDGISVSPTTRDTHLRAFQQPVRDRPQSEQ